MSAAEETLDVSGLPPLSSGGSSGPPDPRVYSVYESIARLMPTEGRDYTVSITISGGDAHLSMRPLTPFGAEFCRHVASSLSGSGLNQENDNNDNNDNQQ